jgi:hypothetical protein
LPASRRPREDELDDLDDPVNTEVAAGDRGGPPSLQHEDVEF